MLTGLGIAGQEQSRGRVVAVGIGIGVRVGQLADAAIRLVTKADAVDQRGVDGVIAQQRGPVGEGIEHGNVEAPSLGDTLPHLRVQAVDEPAVGFPVGVGVAVLREHVRR